MKKILILALFFINLNSVSALYDPESTVTNDEGVMTITADDNVSSEPSTDVTEPYEGVEPGSSLEDDIDAVKRDVDPIIYESEVTLDETDDMVKTTALENDMVKRTNDDKLLDNDLLVYGLSLTTLVSTGLAIYFYSKNKKVN